MNARSLALTLSSLVIAALTTACTPESGAPLTISGIQLFAPLTGSHAAVGYLTVHNQSNAPLTINSISSANFGNVQMHETVIREGIARMQALPTVTIGPDDQSGICSRRQTPDAAAAER